MAGQFELDGKVFNLKLGKSFDNDGAVAYHSIRYDFKPASIDISKDATLEIDEGNSVTVTVPHFEGSGMSHTLFKGNKKPSQKECVLIINHETNEVVLEKLSSFMQVKSTRRASAKSSGGIKRKQDSPAQSTTVSSTQPEKSKPAAAVAATVKSEPPASTDSVKPGLDNRACEVLSASSSDDDMSEASGGDGPDEEPDQVSNSKTTKPPYHHSLLSTDLQLSDTDSD